MSSIQEKSSSSLSTSVSGPKGGTFDPPRESSIMPRKTVALSSVVVTTPSNIKLEFPHN